MEIIFKNYNLIPFPFFRRFVASWENMGCLGHIRQGQFYSSSSFPLQMRAHIFLCPIKMYKETHFRTRTKLSYSGIGPYKPILLITCLSLPNKKDDYKLLHIRYTQIERGASIFIIYFNTPNVKEKSRKFSTHDKS